MFCVEWDDTLRLSSYQPCDDNGGSDDSHCYLLTIWYDWHFSTHHLPLQQPTAAGTIIAFVIYTMRYCGWDDFCVQRECTGRAEI